MNKYFIKLQEVSNKCWSGVKKYYDEWNDGENSGFENKVQERVRNTKVNSSWNEDEIEKLKNPARKPLTSKKKLYKGNIPSRSNGLSRRQLRWFEDKVEELDNRRKRTQKF